MASYCPTCGQRMLSRYGVRLPPRLADLLDTIERAGKRGMLRENLAWIFYPGKSKTAAERLISVHINHLNDFLEETDVKISTSGRRLEPYRLQRRGGKYESASAT